MGKYLKMYSQSKKENFLKKKVPVDSPLEQVILKNSNLMVIKKFNS